MGEEEGGDDKERTKILKGTCLRVLFIGDIVGKAGQTIVEEFLYKIIDRYNVDVCLANCENAAAGFGVTPRIAHQLFDCGIHILTSGNHIWDRKEIIDFLCHEKRLLRPANYPSGTPGYGSLIWQAPSGQKIGVINLCGRVFIESLDCPFKVADRELSSMKSITNIVLVDMHAEATSEKIAMGWYLDGRVSAVVGTHTHVQTADERILPRGTAFITDTGMTGPADSIIGLKKELVIQKFLTKVPVKFEVAIGSSQLNAVVIDIDHKTGCAQGIVRLQMTLP